MVARLIHRYGVADVVFPGARLTAWDEVCAGAAALFGIASAPGDPGHGLRAVAAQALRDAAHLEAAGDFDGFRHRPGRPDGRRLDLGQLQASTGEAALAAAARAIARRGARPVLLGGTPAEALACLEGLAPGDGTTLPIRAVFVSPGLEWSAAFTRLRATVGGLAPGLALGTHDLVARADFVRWTAEGGRVLSAAACAEDGLQALDAALDAAAVAPAFVVLDLSCIDTGHAAGAAADNVGGLEPVEFLAVVAALSARLRWQGVAIVNLAPERDPRGHSERLAARALLKLLEAPGPGAEG